MKKKRKVYERGIFKLFLSVLILLIMTGNAFATNDWKGTNSPDWNTASNWSAGHVPLATEDVTIGVVTFKNQPTVASAVASSVKTLTFGVILSSLTANPVTLTIGSGFSVTVLNNITQSHNSANGGSITTVTGGGVISCSNFLVGNNTTPPTPLSLTIGLANVTNVTVMNLSIQNFNISGGIILNTTSASAVLTVPLVGSFTSTNVNNPLLNLNDGNLSVAGTIQTTNSLYKSTPGFSVTILGIGLVFPTATNLSEVLVNPAGNISGTNPTLLLGGAASLNLATLGSLVDFDNGGAGTSTVNYNGTAQTVYTNTTANLDNVPNTYKNLLLTGTGTATPNGGQLLIGGNFTTSAPTVALNTNNPPVTVAGNWINSSMAVQGTGNITIAGSVTNNAAGTLNLGSANLYIAGNYTNNIGGTYTQSNGTTIFNGTGTQALIDNSTTGTTFNNVNFSGGGTAAMSAGTNNMNFSVSGSGILSMSNNSKLVAGTTIAGGTAYLTLNSDAGGSAAVGAITGSKPISGNVNVQRFLTGGTTQSGGRWVYRGYRLMSSPVSADTLNGYPYTLNYLAASAIVSGAKSSFGTLGGNPTIYLYSEDYTPSNAGFTTGNFKGVTDISNLTSPYSLAITGNGGSKALYAGNGFLFFFRGDNIHNVYTNPGKTVSPFVAPENVVFTATGFLNQNSFTVNNWYSGAGLLYTTVTTPAPGNAAIMGFNLVGNPYPCTIDWETVNSGGIAITNLNPTIWVFDPQNNQYDTYSSSSHLGNSTAFSGKIASGQGFFVRASGLSPALVFNESAKSPSTQLTGINLMMGTANMQTADQQLLRLRLSLDSLNYDDIVIGFNSNATTLFNSQMESKYLAGIGAQEGFSSLSADSVQLSVNLVPLPQTKPLVIRLKTEAANSGLLTFKKMALQAIPPIYEIWLMDNYKKDSLDLKNNATYAFNVDLKDTATYGNRRFKIVIRQNAALGLHLLDFTASKIAGGAETVWKTGNEENYTNFTVERSMDGGKNYSVIGGFTSDGLGSYSFLDKAPVNGTDTYRLKLEDLNGTVSYSKPAALFYNSSGTNLVNVYPNPANNIINVTVNQITPQIADPVRSHTLAESRSTDAILYQIKIVNSSGAIVKTELSSQPSFQGNVSSLLPGTYIVIVINQKDDRVVGESTFVKM